MEQKHLNCWLPQQKFSLLIGHETKEKQQDTIYKGAVKADMLLYSRGIHKLLNPF